MFRGSVKCTGYPLHSSVSPSLPVPYVTVCHNISTGVYKVRACVCVCARAHASCRVSVKYLHVHRNNCSILICSQDGVCDNDRWRRVTTITKEKFERELDETGPNVKWIYDLHSNKIHRYFILSLYGDTCKWLGILLWVPPPPPHWRCGPTRTMASSFLRFLDHKQRRITVGRTPLDEWSARRRDLYLTTHNTHNRQTSMPPRGIRAHNLSRRAAVDLRLRPARPLEPTYCSGIFLK